MMMKAGIRWCCAGNEMLGNFNFRHGFLRDAGARRRPDRDRRPACAVLTEISAEREAGETRIGIIRMRLADIDAELKRLKENAFK